MNPPNKYGVMQGHLCPCGKGAVVQCALCHRALCGWHSAGGPFDEGGQVVLHPVCWPKCDAEWWLNPRDSGSAVVESDEESERTKEHARRLLARGADPDAVAGELGLGVGWVRSEARKARMNAVERRGTP